MLRYWKWLFVLLILSLVGFIPWYFSSLVLYPGVKCNPEHHVFCTDPSELGLSFETVFVPTADGLQTESWYIPGTKADRAIIFVHGHGGSKNEGLRFAKALHEAGYSLLALSLRRNSGSFASMGYYEPDDVKRAVTYLLEEKKVKEVALFGFSMGAASSILAMEKDPRVKAGLFSSGYASAMDVMVESAKRDFGVPYYPLIPMVRMLLNMRGNMQIETVLPEEKIANISPRPIAIFHCDKDHYVDVSHANRLIAKAKQPLEVWIAKCDRHELIWNQNRVEAEKRSVDFFRKYF
ncbi:alpha/beta hydrolase family protein [Leptospira ryugenii]|uniref:Alpha/beta hydrolase family protein n=1 Tax=Leptospira ryugenii TaxID=1917863 RepID=A0A2P2E4C9_9LEPT|nr:alpha/beta fold hydrolase [Leptospira ryugenii]GBF51704.1 alpha/beta hydrolase family protein [Leptospira ryugenii]